MKRTATIQETPSPATGYSWHILDETGHLHTLRGIGSPRDGQAGERGTVEYRTGPDYGLWFWAPEERVRGEGR